MTIDDKPEETEPGIGRKRVKRAIIDFLEKNGESRNKDIGEHIERLKKKRGGLKTNVAVRTGNKYLKELCIDGFVKKK